MKKISLVLGALVVISAIASGQSVTSGGTSLQQAAKNAAPLVIPPGCNPCLWYAGDFDPGNPIASFLNNANNTFGTPFKAQVWVPFIPASDGNPLHKHVLITAITFNELTNTPDTNPPADFGGMTYGFRTGVSSGKSGTSGRHGKCPTTSIIYTGDSPFGYNEFSYTCILTTIPVKVPVGTITWVNLLPTFTVSNTAWLSDAVDVPAGDQLGWSDDFYNSFIDSVSLGYSFAPANTACALAGGCSQFAVAIAGTYVL
jgi:hypothetical protein